MTKLNITNKRIYKLKKHKNQSKKNVPKKRKNKKRGRLGRSFRKRRRKYNIKNNSIKNYKKQKGGVKTDTKIIGKKGEETENVFKSEQLQALENKLGDVQRKIDDLNAKIPDINKKKRTRRITLTKSNALIEELRQLRKDITTDDKIIKDKIDEIRNLHKMKPGDDPEKNRDLKELSEMQIKSIELNFNLEEGGPHFDDAKRLLEGAKAAKITYDKQQKKAAKDKKILQEQMGKRNAWILQINKEIKNTNKEIETNNATIQEKKATLQATETRMTAANAKGDVSESKKINKEVKSLGNEITKLENKNVKLNENIETKQDELTQHQAEDKKENAKFKLLTENKEKNAYILKLEEGLQTLKTMVPFNNDKWMEGFELGENLNNEIDFEYIETLKYAVNKYQNEETHDKQGLKDVTPKKIEDKKKKVADTTNKSLKEIEDVKKEIVTETDKKEKLEKEIKALTKKEDEKLKDEEYKIAKRGFKKGEFEGLEGNIKQQEGVVEKSHEETVKAVKDAEKKKKKADGALFYKDTKRKAADEAQRNVEEKKEQEKKAEESLRAKKHWKKGVKGVGSILHTEIKSSLIVPYVDDNEISRARIIYNERQDSDAKKQKAGEDRKPEFQKFLKDSIESFRVLTDQPYIYNPEGPYARTMDHKQLNKMGEKSTKFYNYYLKKAIKSPDGKEKSLVQMISQRMARYINYVMGTDDEKQSHKETIAYLNKKIQELFNPSHLSIPIDKYIGAEETKNFEFRHHFNEKIQALTFLEILLRQTVKSFPQEDSQRYTDLMETSIDNQPLFNIFCTYLGKCYDIIPGQKLIKLETEYDNLVGVNDNEIMKKGLDGVKVVNEPCAPPNDGNDDLYMRVSRGIDLYSREILEAEEKEKQDFLEALKKYEEHAKETEEKKKEIQGLLSKLQEKTGKIIKEKYFKDSVKEELDKVKQKTHGLKVVTEQLKIKNNTEQAAKIEAIKGKLKEEMAISKKREEELQRESKIAEEKLKQAQQREIELQEQMANAQTAANECDKTNADVVAEKQRVIDEMQLKIDKQKAAVETAKVEAETLATSLEQEVQKIAQQEEEGESLARQEEMLKKTRDELIESAKRDEASDKEEKDEEEEEEEDDEIDLGGIIDEMTPDTNVELEFPKGQQEMVIYAAYDPVTKQVKVDHRFLGSQGRIEDEISNFGIGTEAAN